MGEWAAWWPKSAAARTICWTYSGSELKQHREEEDKEAEAEEEDEGEEDEGGACHEQLLYPAPLRIAE